VGNGRGHVAHGVGGAGVKGLAPAKNKMRCGCSFLFQRSNLKTSKHMESES
jgi:hypothetical protein